MADEQAVGQDSAQVEKTKRFCSKDYDLDENLVSFEFGDGRTLELKMADVPVETQKQLMLHGALQKIGDSYAGAKGDFNAGHSAASDVIEQLKAGVWKAGRGEGEGRPRLGELAEAISRIKEVPFEKAMAAVEKGTDEQRKQWRSNATVKSTIAQIRAEKAKKELEGAAQQELAVNFD